MLTFVRKLLGINKELQPDLGEYVNLGTSSLDYLSLGDKVEDFTLKSTDGVLLNLYDILKKQTVILSFYRGSWCPHCSLHLKSLEEEYKSLISGGVKILGVSPDPSFKNIKYKEEQGISFDLLYDKGNTVARNFGIVVEVEKRVANNFKSFFQERFEKEGDSAYEVPIPATFIIDKKGVVVYSFLDTDYTVRLSPKQLVKMVYKKVK